MASFLTGLAVATVIFVATWAALQPSTVTTIERNGSVALNLGGDSPRGESWE
jgi:hypothetical protein